MNKIVLNTSLLWLALIGIAAGVYLHHTRSKSSYSPVSASSEPIATGPTADAGSNAPLHTGKMETPLAPIQLTDEQRDNIGVKSGKVEYQRLSDEIRAMGTVDVDERLQSSVQIRFSGYIRRVFADATYRYVRKGDPLFTIYSPELVATQEEYLLARRNETTLSASAIDGVASGASSLATAAEQRLLQWDIPESEIAKLRETGKALDELTIDSPASGYIMQRTVLPNMYVEPATKLYTLAELSRVWVNAEVFQNDVGRVKRGDRSSVTVDAYPDRVFSGRVEEILPEVDLTTRTVKVRIEVDNTGIVLKPGMYVNVDLRSALGRQLVVPVSAVFQTGLRQVVFIDHGNGNLEPRDVRLGERVGDSYIVLGGLAAHQSIVTSANFLLDSESQLDAASGSYTSPVAIAGQHIPNPSATPQPTYAIDFVTDPSPMRRGPNILHVKLAAADGQPIPGCQVAVTFFMAAMPAMGMGAMNVTAQLLERSAGVYDGTGILETGGTWQVTVTVRQNGKTVATKQLRVNAEGGM